ncbi:MAG TPA: aldo/keto reductase [Ohtaekwangia sp.]|uniref:aldo/keto reductase n=1 Tax=Ohtaekwangia sp. TaxID=2066019 RepID=UPI002F91D416
MKYRKLGGSDLSVSKVSFGCMSLGTDNDANASLLHRAADAGINYFDTADIYQNGFNEETVGRALKPIRTKVILATKVGNRIRPDGSLDWDASKKYILQSVDKSLARLQTDYIDVYQLHGGTIQDPIDETIEAFELLKQQGKIRHYGISSIRPNVIREYIKRSRIVSVMMQYSLLDRRPEEECLDLLHQYNISVLARGSIAKGLLAGKAPEPFLNHTAEEVSRAAAAIQSVSGTKKTPASAAIYYTLHHPAVASAVVGIRTPQQLEESIDAMSSPPLTSTEINLLQKSIPANHYELHK